MKTTDKIVSYSIKTNTQAITFTSADRKQLAINVCTEMNLKFDSTSEFDSKELGFYFLFVHLYDVIEAYHFGRAFQYAINKNTNK